MSDASTDVSTASRYALSIRGRARRSFTGKLTQNSQPQVENCRSHRHDDHLWRAGLDCGHRLLRFLVSHAPQKLGINTVCAGPLVAPRRSSTAIKFREQLEGELTPASSWTRQRYGHGAGVPGSFRGQFARTRVDSASRDSFAWDTGTSTPSRGGRPTDV